LDPHRFQKIKFKAINLCLTPYSYIPMSSRKFGKKYTCAYFQGL
jgi:hypothetical protein